jgi:hypothetical protein
MSVGFEILSGMAMYYFDFHLPPNHCTSILASAFGAQMYLYLETLDTI